MSAPLSILTALLAVTVAAVAGLYRWLSSTANGEAAQLTVVRLGWEGGREEWLRGRETRQSRRDADLLPFDWDSSACLRRWGLPWLQTEPDPAGNDGSAVDWKIERFFELQ